MEILFYILLTGAAVGVIVGLLVQLLGSVLIVGLTLASGVREYWTNQTGTATGKT